MWYVSSPDDVRASFDSKSGSITGKHGSVDKDFWLSIQDEGSKYATYSDGLGNDYYYNSTYYSALTVDEKDQYDPKKYFFNEVKDEVRTTPPHLFDSGALYREDNTFSGNLITSQRFYELPFTADLHFGYRNSTWTPEDMNMNDTSEMLLDVKAQYDKVFEMTFFGPKFEELSSV